MKYLFLLTLTTLIITGCNCMQKNTKTTTDPFTENHKWEMTAFKGESTATAGFTAKTPTVIIDKEKGRISGNNGCNSFGGNAKVKNSSIEFGMFMATKMFCNGVPEKEFFDFFEGEVNYEVKGDTLTFTKGGESVVFLLIKD